MAAASTAFDNVNDSTAALRQRTTISSGADKTNEYHGAVTSSNQATALPSRAELAESWTYAKIAPGLIAALLENFFTKVFAFFGISMSGKKTWLPDEQIPDLQGKVILVTGGNAGIGKETVLRIAKHNPGKLYMAARTASKAEEAINSIKQTAPNANIVHLPLDLTSFKSVSAAAERVLSESDRLDILINNAGIMGVPPSMTEDGYELQFGTNHMGPALLTKLLMPLLLKTSFTPNADVRVITLTSEGHQLAPSASIIFDQNKLNEQGPMRRYGHSKLANILFAKELTRRYPRILTTAVHPGVVDTELISKYTSSGLLGKLQTPFFSLFKITVEEGARTTLWSAFAPREEVKTGQYYLPVGKAKNGSGLSRNAELAKQLWDWQEKEFENHGFTAEKA